MAYILQKAAEEVTERALVPYVKEKIVESGLSTIGVRLSTAVVKWLPWSGVVMQSAGIYQEVSHGLTYSGGASWLVKQFVYWCFPHTKGFIITGRCLSFISGIAASISAAGTPTFPLLLAGTLGALRSLLMD
jgi:hypothetical protein|tara:strand:- start:1122 stop:1517 length:396 start_codon:yes stop_codon:yes gene_type:complete